MDFERTFRKVLSSHLDQEPTDSHLQVIFAIPVQTRCLEQLNSAMSCRQWVIQLKALSVIHLSLRQLPPQCFYKFEVTAPRQVKTRPEYFVYFQLIKDYNSHIRAIVQEIQESYDCCWGENYLKVTGFDEQFARQELLLTQLLKAVKAAVACLQFKPTALARFIAQNLAVDLRGRYQAFVALATGVVKAESQLADREAITVLEGSLKFLTWNEEWVRLTKLLQSLHIELQELNLCKWLKYAEVEKRLLSRQAQHMNINRALDTEPPSDSLNLLEGIIQEGNTHSKNQCCPFTPLVNFASLI